MRRLFPLIFIFFILSLFSLKFIFLLPILFVPLIFIKRKDFTLFFILFITIGILRGFFFPAPSFKNITSNYLKGKVISFERETSFELKTDYGNITVYKSKDYGLKPFDEVEVRGEFIDDFGGNPGEESFILYSISKNSILRFYAKSVKVLRKDRSLVSRFREKLYERFNLLKENLSFLRGIFMGGGGVDRETKEKFKYAGVMHLLAVSGLHLSILSLFLSFFLPPIFVVLVLFIYLYIILFPISAVRAFIMLSVYLIGRSFYRDVDSLNSLLFGAMIILFLNPLSILSPSFLLTFLSTLSIVSILSNVRRKLNQALLVSPVSLVGIFPVITYYFSIFSPVSIVSNIVISPIFALLLPLTFVSLSLSLLYKNFILLLKFPGKVFLSLVNLFSKTPISSIGIKKPHPLFIILYLILFLIFVVKINWKVKIKWEKTIIFILIFLLIISFLYPYYAERGVFKVIFFDVGEGDSIFIKTPENITMLVDGGGKRNGKGISPGDRVLDSLKRLGVNRIDIMVFTHEDIDHIEGLFHVIERESVGKICGPDIELGEIGKRLIEIGRSKGGKFIPLKRGDVIKLGKYTKIYVLNPVEGGKDYGRARDNNNSVFLLVDYKGFSLALSADVEKEGLGEISDEFPVLLSDVDVYKVSHHGSRFSFSEEFFDILSPKISVISVGPNRFGHPSPLIMNSLIEHGSKIFRTDRDGAVEISVKRDKLKIKTYNFKNILDIFYKNHKICYN